MRPPLVEVAESAPGERRAVLRVAVGVAMFPTSDYAAAGSEAVLGWRGRAIGLSADITWKVAAQPTKARPNGTTC